MRSWSAALALVLASVGGGTVCAQEEPAPLRFRLTLEETPRVGRQAPALVLPYATQRGPGPASQPFDLSRELGRVVVLIFYPDNASPASIAEWRALRERASTLASSSVVLVGISTDSLASHVRFAAELDLPFKLLSDPDRAIIQRYGVSDGPRARRAAVVVGPDGVVRYIDPAFAALDSASYVHLAAAVRAAQERQ